MNAMTMIQRTGRMLEAGEELELYHRHMEGDGRATRILVEAHMPLIHKIAGRYSRFGERHADIVQEGVLGFIQGLAHFDAERGFRLNTLCRWWVKAAVTEWVRTNHSLVRIGTTAAQKKLFGSLREAMSRRGIYADGALTRSELAQLEQDLGIPAKEIQDMSTRISVGAETSLDAAIGGPGADGARRVDQLPDERTMPEDLEDRMDDARRSEALRAALTGLDARKRDIIERRYLADDTETLEQLSDTYGVTRERIRQLEVQAIQELGSSLSAKLSRMAGQERRSARGTYRAAA